LKTNDSSTISGGAIPLIAPDLLAEIIATSSDISVLLTPAGAVQSVMVNRHHRSFGQLGHWEGKPFRDVLKPESIVKFDARLAQLRESGRGVSLVAELNHTDTLVAEFPVRYALHQIRPDGSLLLLGRDMRPIAEMQQKLVAAQMALEKDYEAQREMDTRYRVLMQMTRDAVLLVSAGNGRIADLNPAAAKLLGGSRAELVGAAVAQEFEGRRRGELMDAMNGIAAPDAATPIELQTKRSRRRVLLVPTLFRAAGERLFLCRLDTPAETVPLHDELRDNLDRLYHAGVDSIVFTDRDGVIRAANEAFLNLTDQPNQAAVTGRSLADFLARGMVDMRILLDNARRAGHLRQYGTRLTTAFSGQIAVEISAAWLNDRAQAVMGLVIRDASRVESMRRPGYVTDEGMASAAELVGSSRLKDIVAETAEVVEKLCIETAVELTRNNRVAAAEMLGLSRQSLYVKLRKYGLLNRDGE
jgi:transcriptional regulator PpsR